MRPLLRNLPFREASQTVQVGQITVEIKPFQILTWVTLCREVESSYDQRAPLVPAVFDTGFNGTFCIREEQLRMWGGLDRRMFPLLRVMRTNRGLAAVHKADLWLHGNVAGTLQPSRQDQLRLELDQGMLVFPAPRAPTQDDPRPPLPLLGMRAFHRNDLRLLIDFKRQFVNLKKPRWFFTSYGI